MATGHEEGNGGLAFCTEIVTELVRHLYGNQTIHAPCTVEFVGNYQLLGREIILTGV